MIYLFAGEEYLVNTKLKSLMSTEGISVFESPFPIEQIKSQALMLPFFSEKQTIVIKGLLKSKDKDGQKEIANLLSKLPTSTDLIFVEGELDERLSLLKTIRKLGKVEIFSALKGAELTRWVQDMVKAKGGQIQPALADKLGSMVGSDLVRLNNEIDKLLAYNPEIKEEAINELVDEGFFESIFAFTDALSAKNPKKAISLLNKLMAGENNEMYLLSMLARQARILLTVKDLSTDNNEAGIVKISKLNPYVVKKTLPQARNFEINKLVELHESILEADKTFKSSSVDPKIVLTKLVYNFSK
jgi:DNA polymerase-3 subunit delta